MYSGNLKCTKRGEVVLSSRMSHGWKMTKKFSTAVGDRAVIARGGEEGTAAASEEVKVLIFPD